MEVTLSGWQHRTTVREGSATRELFFREQVAAQTIGGTSTHGRVQREIDEGLEKLQKQCAAVAEKRIISRCGAGRHKVHLAMVVAEGAVPVDWRTCCGLKKHVFFSLTLRTVTWRPSQRIHYVRSVSVVRHERSLMWNQRRVRRPAVSK